MNATGSVHFQGCCSSVGMRRPLPPPLQQPNCRVAFHMRGLCFAGRDIVLPRASGARCRQARNHGRLSSRSCGRRSPDSWYVTPHRVLPYIQLLAPPSGNYEFAPQDENRILCCASRSRQMRNELRNFASKRVEGQ